LVGLALGEAAPDKLVHRGDDVTPVDPGMPPKIGLAGGAVLVERGEQSEVVAADTFGAEGVRQQTLRSGVGPAQQPRRPCRNPPQR
jgi:hypothetical protein